jgi:hypothetical protein
MEEELYTVQKTVISKIEDNALYQKYFNKPIRDVPIDDADTLLKLFLDKAAVNVGKDAYDKPDATKRSILEFIYKDFNGFPVFLIGSAIIRGSLGIFGSARLVPGSVYGWLNEMRPEYERLQKQEQFKKEISNRVDFDLWKYPVGKAMIMKIDWYNAKLITDDDWDKIDLKVLAGMIAGGQHPTTRDFGIKN